MKKRVQQLLIFIIAFSGCSRTDNPLPVKEGKIIVLMYHRITEGEASNLYERSAVDFNSDLIYLIYNKINIIDFTDLKNIKESGKMPEGNSAIITFDDGDGSWYNSAMPLLKKYNIKATFFLWAEMIGHDSFITWNQVEFMSNYQLPGGIQPFTFGSHSYSHQYLLERKNSFSTIDEYNSFLDYELGISKNLIETYIPGKVIALSLPFGDGEGDPNIIAAAQRNGYSFIRTSRYGAIENTDLDLFNIPSLTMLDKTDSEEIGYCLKR